MKLHSGFVSNSSSSSFIIYGYRLELDTVAERVGVIRTADMEDWDYAWKIDVALTDLGVECLTDGEQEHIYIGKIIADDGGGEVRLPLSAFNPAFLRSELAAMMERYGKVGGNPMIIAGERAT